MLRTWVLFFINLCPVVLLTWLVVTFVRRRLWRDLPFFALYLVSTLLTTVARYVALRFGPRAYFYTFWITDFAVSMAVFLTMYEVFVIRLFAKSSKNRFYRVFFPCIATAILLFTLLIALQAHDPNTALVMVSRGFDFTRVSVLSFFIALMLFMGRQWTRYDLGITLGFSFQAAVALACSAVRLRTRQAAILDAVTAAENIAYNVCCVIWVITFWKPEEKTPALSTVPLDPAMLHQAHAWQSLLKKWLTPAGVKSGHEDRKES